MAAALGPVSAVLESDLRGVVRRHGIVVWLDLDGHYTGFVDRLSKLRAAGELPYEVHAYRGSYLELMLALAPLAGGTEKTPLVIHLPGFNEDRVRTTPLLELYTAGVRYRKALDTLVAEAAAGRVQPEDLTVFCAREDLSLGTADQWLSFRLDGRDTGLAAQLRALSPTEVMDDLLTGGAMARQLAAAEAWDALWHQLSIGTGMPAAWREGTLAPGALHAEDVAFVAASWTLCVEYVDDLRRAPVDRQLTPVQGLPRPLVDACRRLAADLRQRHPAFYQRTADETEAWLTDEVAAARAEDLGKIDTFRFEEDKVLEAALAALAEAAWLPARQWADARAGDSSFWVRADPSRRAAWQLIGDATLLGEAIAAAGSTLRGSDSLETALKQYEQRGAAVDQAHRHLEQRRAALLDPRLPAFEQLRARLDDLRRRWRDWADAWALAWNSLCRTHGFLPPPQRQQRTLFDEVVRPLCQESRTTALFLVDALRFEMGEELYRALAETPATTAQLRARLAELPTVTEVGMNVLAPVAVGGRLRPAMSGGSFLGFSAGEFRVSSPETRKRAMHDRVGGSTCPWLTLQEVLDREPTSLKQAVARARLVVVHSLEIDAAGEAGVGLAVFDQVLQNLRSAWRLLREAGVQSFVITADHGFLLFDSTAGVVQPHGRKIDPKRRHVLSEAAADHSDEVRVPLADLGYEGAEGHLMFPETTALFDTGGRAPRFVHGGNSLQERVIPVLSLVHRSSVGGSVAAFSIAAHAREAVAGMHCVSALVEAVAQQALNFGGPREIELRLQSTEAPDVQVELCQTRGGARLSAGGIVARVGEAFELFFRLSGPAEARVLVELHHPGGEADVAPCTVEGRFGVNASGAAPVPATGSGAAPAGGSRLEQFPEGGIRQLFEHLATHGVVTEPEAAEMLGGQRALRRFAHQFEQYAAKAPFTVRIDVVAGVKRYVREGTAP